MSPIQETQDGRLITSVREAAYFLDLKVPDWATRINLDRLNMQSNSSCVLGQLFNGYGKGLSELGLAAGRESAFSYLCNDNEWKAEVYKRLQKNEREQVTALEQKLELVKTKIAQRDQLNLEIAELLK